MNRLTPIFLLALGIGTATACNDDPGPLDQVPSGSPVVMLEEGTGSTNSEPLWRLTPGMRIGNVAVVLPPVEFEGLEVLPLGTIERGPNEDFLAPSEPARWMYLTQDEEGAIWFHGEPRSGRLNPPALLVPAEVRVGMRWNTGRFAGGQAWGRPDIGPCHDPSPRAWEGHSCQGSPRFTIEVAERAEIDTIYGTRPVWSLLITDWGRHTPAYQFPGYPDEPVWDGVPSSLQFVEGRGPLNIPLKLDDPTAAATGSGVVPLEPFVSQGVLPPIQLQPLTEHRLIDDGALATSASAYFDPSLGTTVVSSHRVASVWAPALIEGGADIPGFANSGMEGCWGRDSGESLDVDACRWGAGVTVSTSGDRALTLDLLAGGLPWRGAQMIGLFEHDDTFWGLGVSRDIEARQPLDAIALGELDPDGDIDHVPSIVNEFDTIWLELWPRVPGVVLSGGASMWVDGDGSAIRLAEFGGLGPFAPTNGIRFSQWDRDAMRPRFEHLAYPSLMDINTTSEPGGKTVLLTTFAGRIDRMYLVDDGIEIEPLGDVAVPDGQFMTGAVLADGELIVFTQRDFTGIDVHFDRGFTCNGACTGLNRATPPQHGQTLVWRADLPTPVTPERPSPQWGVTARPTGLDVRVCWPPGHGAPELDGWTLGGHPPRAVTTVGGEDHCVLLSRDLAIPDVLSAHAAWAVEGPLPGYGRVAIGTTGVGNFDHDCWGNECQNAQELRNATHTLETAVSTPNGLGGVDVLLGEGAAYPHYSSTFRERLAELLGDGRIQVRVEVQILVQDEGGAGVWGFDPYTSTLYLWDGETLEVMTDETFSMFDFEDGGRMRTSTCQGGGLLFDTFYLAPDGDTESVPPGLDSLDSALVRLADGTVCGVGPATSGSNDRVVCLGPDGDRREGPEHHTVVGYNPRVGADGVIYFTSTDITGTISRLQTLDPATMAVAPVDADALGIDLPASGLHGFSDWTTDEAGVPYAVYSVPRDHHVDHFLLRFGEAGIEHIERPELSYMAYRSRLELLVDADFYVFFPHSAGSNLLLPAVDLTRAWSWFTWPRLLRVPREGDVGRSQNDFSAGASGCVPIDDLEADTLTDAQSSLVQYVGCGGVQCALATGLCSTALLDESVEVVDENGVPAPSLISGNGTRRFSPLQPFTRYTVRGVIDDVPVETEFVTSNAGQHFEGIHPSEPAISELAGYIADWAPGCGIDTASSEDRGCGFRTDFDPTNRRLLVENNGTTMLIKHDGALGVTVESIDIGPDAVFSPDGRMVFGAEAAWDTVDGERIEFSAARDTARAPLFALPEHPYAFLPMADGGGLVVEWDEATGELDDLITTEGALDASFSGDGESVVTLESALGGGFEVVRYNLATGSSVSTPIGTGPYARVITNGAGDVTYVLNRDQEPRGGETNDLTVTLVREDEALIRFPRIVQWTRDGQPALAVDRRGESALVLAAHPDRGSQVHLVDEDATGDAEIDFTDVFVPVERFRFTLDDAHTPVSVGHGGLLLATGRDAETVLHIVSAADAADALVFNGTWQPAVRNDGRVVLVSGDCIEPGSPCRELMVLSPDQTAVDESFEDDGIFGYTTWPFGLDRERTETPVEGVVVYWRHFDPTGLDLPCFLTAADGGLFCR